MRRVLAAVVTVLAGCVTPAPVKPAPPPTAPVVVAPPRSSPDERRAAHEAIGRFLDAAEAGKFADALALLAEPWRSRYSAQRLGADFTADPSVKARLANARAALGRTIDVRGDTAVLPLENGKRLRAVREQGAWRVAALEE